MRETPASKEAPLTDRFVILTGFACHHLVVHDQKLAATLKREAPLALAYSVLYVGSLFFTIETEGVHWLTLVVGPYLLLRLLQRRRGIAWKETLASVGLRRGNLRHGLLLAIVVALLFGSTQLVVSDQRDEILRAFTSGRFLYLLPVMAIAFLLTAGSTEEFFFRGILQTRLLAWSGSQVVAIFGAAVVFGLYHLPYAYLVSEWPSHGHLIQALVEGSALAAIGGVFLGAVYARAGNNLLASIVAHSLFNAIPGMTMLHIHL